MVQLRLNRLPRTVARQSRWGVYARTVLLIVVSVLALAGCAESLTNCKGGNILLRFSPVSDFACPEQPTDTVGDVDVSPSTDANNQIIPNQIELSWTNPSQIDLSKIEIRWSIATAADVQAQAEPIVAHASLNAPTSINATDTTGTIQIPDVQPGQAMMHTITGITDGKTYQFAISAIDQVGNIATVKDIYYITRPTGLTAVLDGRQVTLAWASVFGATEYYVYRTVGSGSAARITTRTAITEPTFIDTDVSRGSSYSYTVRAVIGNGDTIVESADSNEVVATTGAGTPSGLAAVPGYRQVTLTWDSVDDAQTYRIHRAEGGNTPVFHGDDPATAGTATYVDTIGLEDNTFYTYRISAVNAAGEEGDQSSPIITQTAPAIPDGFTVTPGDERVVLAWSAVTNAARYKVYRAASSTVVPSSGTLVTTVNNPTVSYTDSGRANGTQYAYAVTAVNAAGTESDASATRSVTPLDTPDAPASLTATAGNGEVVLTWTAPAGGGGAVTGYRIYRATGSSIGTATPLVTTPATLSSDTLTYTDVSAANGTAYTYAIRAVNANGTESDNSVTATATPFALAGTPGDLTAEGESGAVKLTWDVPTGVRPVSYHIYRVIGRGTPTVRIATGTPITATTNTATTVSYTDSTVTNGTEYTYAVRAVSAGSTESGDSNTTTVTPLATPSAPTDFTATAGDGQVTLAWTAVTGTGVGTVRYEVYRGIALITTVNTVTYTDSTVTNGTTYSYTILAVNANDAKSAGATGSATPLAIPSAPTGLTATAGTKQVTLTWSAPSGTGVGTAVGVVGYRIYRITGSSGTPATVNRIATGITIVTATYTDTGLADGTAYRYIVRAINANEAESGNSNTVSATTITPLAAPANLKATIVGINSVKLDWTNPNPLANNLSAIRISWAIVTSSGLERGSHTITSPVEGGAATYTVNNLQTNTAYRFSAVAIGPNTIRSSAVTVDGTPRIFIDSNNNNLIDINNLEMLNNIRFNLAGTSYKTSSGDSGARCGTNGATACTGYELMRDLDFAAATSYESGGINSDWQPTGGTPASATNAGWTPIGTAADPFLTTFEGNGKSISSLYVRVTTSGAQRIGLFGQVGSTSTAAAIQNLIVRDGAVYGGTGSDYAGGIAGALVNGTIIDSFVIGGTINGGAGALDRVGGLVGENNGTVAASYATATVDGAGGDTDYVGGLVGENTGTISASYATGNITGGADASDRAGGLVGINSGTITASYAVGAANGGAGATDRVGGLVGSNIGSGIISQSYSTAGTDGGDDTDDFVGALVGENSSGTINDSYGFGVVVGNEQGSSGPSDGTAEPSAVTNAAQLTTTTTASTTWNTVAGGAWDLGTNTEIPLLKYADYDGGSGIDYCAATPAVFPSIVPGTTDTLTCGTTLIPGQSALRARAVPPAPVTSLTATIASETSIQLDWSNPSDADLFIIRISWATVAIPGAEVGNFTRVSVTPSGAATYTVIGLTTDTPYRFSVTAVDTDSNRSTPETVDETPRLVVDPDGNNLIDINNLEMLNNIRHNLAGTSYKTSGSDVGTQCGTDGMVTCIGYELMRDLDFAVGTSYASGSVNSSWRPSVSNNPAASTNAGWIPIETFTTTFEGNGHAIRNLYVRRGGNSFSAVGLFGQVNNGGGRVAMLRNITIEDGSVYGAGALNVIGILAGWMQNGTILNSSVRRGSVNGGAGGDHAGGLVGTNAGTIVGSYSTAAVNGDGTGDNVGGLVGQNTGSIIASYASGSANGGAGTDNVGGLVGENSGSITAGYSSGSADGGPDNTDRVGGLVGKNTGTTRTITASYTVANVDGGAGSDDHASGLVGYGDGAGAGHGITNSYAFGNVVGNENSTGNYNTTGYPNGVANVTQLTAANSRWNTNTIASTAWNFTAGQPPTLRYADYDGTGTTHTCGQFSSMIPGTTTAIACGTTLLRGQIAIPTTWTSQTIPTANTLRSVHHANGIWVAVGGSTATSTIITSTNGTTWTIQASPTNDALLSVHHANGTWVAVGGKYNTSTIITSTNGTTWAIQTSPTILQLFSVHHANGTWVAVGDGGAIITSPDGITWTPRTNPTNRALLSVHHANGTWVAVGGSYDTSTRTSISTIITSPNGTIWTSQTSPTAHTLQSVHHANGTWVAVGNITIITSPDGITWTPRTNPTNRALLSVHHANGTWVAVGGIGTIITSTNGTTWTSQTRPTTSALSFVYHANGRWIAMGQSGTIVTSTP